MKKISLEEKLLREGLFASKEEMLPFVMAGKVLVQERPAHSLAEKVAPDAAVRVKEFYKTKYVSKGGLKLEHAIKTFGIAVSGRVALDCGASTGGFTDCLLSFGADTVYAVDAGYGQLAPKLATSPRVVNLERTNLSDPTLRALAPHPSLVTLDLSYLSLREGILAAREILAGDGEILALIKPIYETEDAQVRRSGDINRPDLHREVIEGLLAFCREEGLFPSGVTYSPVRGNGGAVEYFLALSTREGRPPEEGEVEAAIAEGLRLPKFKK